MDQRLQQLTHWAEQIFAHHKMRIELASGDASFRRYFRVYTDNKTFILMDAPPDKEDSRPFIKIAAWLHEMGLSAPEILQRNEEIGFYLLTDLGTEQYLSHLNEDSADMLYRDAINALLIMQNKGKALQAGLPPYDQQLLNTEMQLFADWYLVQHLGHKLSMAQTEILTSTFSMLAESALQQPKVFVHRDYHSRNLMYINHEAANVAIRNPGILDFQDAVWGPITYDLVSLLRDCYIAWPDEQVYQWMHYHFEALQHQGLLHDVSLEQYKIWFDLMGVQRHLKATGIFARLNYRDSKPGYLADIPRTMGYVLSVANHYPELKPFLSLLDDLSVTEQLTDGDTSRLSS